MGYDVATTDDVDSVVPEEYGGMWFLRDELDADNLGLTVLELEPGGTGKEHDHAGDGHEEIYLVVSGELDVDLPDGTVTLGPEEAIRLDADTTRQVHNRGDDPVRAVLAGAP